MWIALLLMAVAAIGVLDVWSGPELGMSLFYLVPVSVAAWRLGRVGGVVVAVAAAVTWLSSDLLTRPLSAASAWNGLTRLVIFTAMAVLINRVQTERRHHIALNKLREDLLYSVAHELRGPLGVLQNALDILAEDYAELSADEFARMAGSARRTAGRLRTLMEDLLSAGSIQAGRFRVDPQPIELRALIAEALESVEPLTEERRQSVDVDVPDGVVVQADRRYARQVLTNLLGNAARYGPAGSAIRVHAQRTDGHVRVAVHDHGPGIEKDEQALLFERFYRPKAEGHGIGLGLAIAKGIVDAHGGRIGIDSGPGRGTSVWFTLPVAAGQ